MTFTIQEISQIKQAAQSVISVTLYDANRDDAIDNSAYLAYEIINLTEWTASAISHQGAIAKLVLDSYPWPMGVSVEVASQFNLPY